ncbi:MAG: DUF4198 domain-containing protein [Longimicrobiales bacterium]
MRRSLVRHGPVAVGLLAVTALLSLPASAHDFWLIPHVFRLAPGQELIVDGRTSSTFPTSLSAVTPDRIGEARILTAGTSETLSHIGVDGSVLRLSHRPTDVGQAVIAVRVLPREIPESPESFRNYLRVEGAPEALERYEREGILPTDSIIRRYAKYAKTVVEVGSGGRRAFLQRAEHPFEFTPLADPGSVEPGQLLRIQVEFLGEPLAGARIHAGVATEANATASVLDQEYLSDEAGIVAVPLAHAGIWNVRALHIVPAPAGSGADWDVHWATLVWQIG